MKIVPVPNHRGFMRGEFKDRNGEECSIQESSIATEDCLWLGVNKNRMHLDKETAVALLGLLAHFVAHGNLHDPNWATAHKLTDAILTNLRGRKGFQQVWDCNDEVTQAKLRGDLDTLIYEVLDGQTAEEPEGAESEG